MLFLFVFSILWKYVFSVLWLLDDAIEDFYDEPGNSLDVIYVGGSNVGAHFNSTLAYREYGFTTGMMTSGSQPFTSTKYLIKEVEKYQEPKLYIIDLASATDDFSYRFQDEWCRSVVDYMKFTRNRIDAINNILFYADVPKEEYIYYYFSFLKYHNGWKTINNLNFNNPAIKGYWYYPYIFRNADNYVEYVWEEEERTLPQDNEEVLVDLLNYLQENDLNVLFVIPNRYFSEYDCQLFNSITKIVKNYGYNVINFNLVDGLELDKNVDFYDNKHLNIYGATKFTLFFAEYLKKNYNLDDHRGDKLYESWEDAYNRFRYFFDNLVFYKFPNVV